MISQFTWPNHDLPSDKEAVKKLLEGCGFGQDTAYGKTKVFIRTPRTLFSLEEQRADMVQRIVLFLQKVKLRPYCGASEFQCCWFHCQNPDWLKLSVSGRRHQQLIRPCEPNTGEL